MFVSTDATPVATATAFGVEFENYAEYRAALEAHDADEMDAPSDWDAGAVEFDPYI